MERLIVEPLPSPEHAGDWHDAPLKWIVRGPGAEIQKFSRKVDARQYASIRRKSPSFNAACSAFVRAPAR